MTRRHALRIRRELSKGARRTERELDADFADAADKRRHKGAKAQRHKAETEKNSPRRHEEHEENKEIRKDGSSRRVGTGMTERGGNDRLGR